MKSGKNPADFQALAENLVELGRKNGADEVEVSVCEGSEFSADIRIGQIENLVEAGSCGLSLRIIKDQKTALAASSDLKEKTLHGLVKNAIKRAEVANPDEFAGLPELEKKITDAASLKLYDPDISSLGSREKIDLAMETERRFSAWVLDFKEEIQTKKSKITGDPQPVSLMSLIPLKR